MNPNEYKVAKTIVKHLEADLNTARNQLPIQGHDDREALIVTLERALSSARNVLRGEERHVKRIQPRRVE